MRRSFWYFLLSVFFIIFSFLFYSLKFLPLTTNATSATQPCVDYLIVFARGSGEELHTNIDHQAFSKAISEIFRKLPQYSYRYYQLGESDSYGQPYPAIGIEDPKIISGAILSGGKAFAFGRSVKTGINELTNLYRQVTKTCPNTQFILSGYSQGAMVMTYAIRHFNPDKILYLANFGDPKLYLPEGKGIIPDACKKLNLSPYRQNIPDCYVEHGLLGGLDPYVYAKYRQKVGAWCNIADFICGSTFDPLGLSDPTQNSNNDLFAKIFNGHVSYSRRGAYQEAAQVIYRKIAQDSSQSITQKQTLIHYYHPEQLDIHPLFPKHYSKTSQLPKRPFVNNELVIMLPTFLTDPGDAREYLLLNQLFDQSYNHHFLIHLYQYGFFPTSLPDPPIYFSQKLDQNAPVSYKQGVRYIASMYTTDMSSISLDQILKTLRRRIYNTPNINLPRLLDHSLYDVITNTPWAEAANHLLFLLTPNQTINFTYDNKEFLSDLINQQIKEKQLSSFIYNFNPSLSKHLKSYDAVSSENIFDTDHDLDDIIQRILQENQTKQLDQLLRPRFDSLDLRFNGQNFLLKSPLKRSKRSINIPPHNQNTDNISQSFYKWTISQLDKTREYKTQTPRLRLHVDSILPNSIQIYDHNNISHQTNLVFLHKKVHEPQALKNLGSTVFPYRLIIIDDYIAGFTNQKRLTFKNIDPTSPHIIREIKFSSLGRIINQKTTTIPTQDTNQSPEKKYSNITQDTAKQNKPKNQPTHSKDTKHTKTNSNLINLINKLPNCGAKERSPIPKVQYFNAFFY